MSTFKTEEVEALKQQGNEVSAAALPGFGVGAGAGAVERRVGVVAMPALHPHRIWAPSWTMHANADLGSCCLGGLPCVGVMDGIGRGRGGEYAQTCIGCRRALPHPSLTRLTPAAALLGSSAGQMDALGVPQAD